MNIWGFRSNFVGCESFLKSNSPEILVLYETNLDDTIDFNNFYMRRYTPLIQKDSSIHMHGLTVYVYKGLSFRTKLISRKLCRLLFMFLTSFMSLSV